MSDYFKCIICDKEYLANLAQSPFPYPSWEWDDCMFDMNSLSCKCCTGCYLTYVAPMITNDYGRYKKEMEKHKIRLIKGR